MRTRSLHDRIAWLGGALLLLPLVHRGCCFRSVRITSVTASEMLGWVPAWLGTWRGAVLTAALGRRRKEILGAHGIGVAPEQRDRRVLEPLGLVSPDRVSAGKALGLEGDVAKDVAQHCRHDVISELPRGGVSLLLDPGERLRRAGSRPLLHSPSDRLADLRSLALISTSNVFGMGVSRPMCTRWRASPGIHRLGVLAIAAAIAFTGGSLYVRYAIEERVEQVRSRATEIQDQLQETRRKIRR